MESARFSFTIEGVSAVLGVASFRAREAMNELFELSLVLRATEPLVFADALDKPACLVVAGETGPRYMHGVVARLEVAEEGAHFTLYHAVVVPKAFHLANRVDCRIFQELSAPAIIQEVLQGAGLSAEDFRVALQKTYPPREYCVQFRETDLGFVFRLMEEEGICAFFEQTETGHTWVFGDASSVHEPVPESSVPFRAAGGALGMGERVYRCTYGESVRSGTVSLRDYHFVKPSLDLTVSAAAAKDTALEVYDYPGDYSDPGRGKALATLRLEALRIGEKSATGESDACRMIVGATFSLIDHGVESLNRGYLLTAVEHEGRESATGAAGSETHYLNRFVAIPDDIVFRPARRTRKPMIPGVESAIVVGPPGEEIHTDEHGRIKVQFHWDRLGKNDDKSSCWMRVAQIWAGASYGGLILPRIGHEVLVSFVDGDPDRPIVVGRVYHGANVPPYALPGEKTKSTWKSSTSPGGGGSNELRFEDKSGAEEVYLHAQKDWNTVVENDKTLKVGHDELGDVTNDRTRTVGNDETLTISNNRSITVGGNETRSVDKNAETMIGGNAAMTVTGTSDTVSDGAMTIDSGTSQSLSAPTQALTADSEITLTVGGSSIAIKPDSITITASGNTVKLSAAGIDIQAAAMVTVMGSLIKLN